MPGRSIDAPLQQALRRAFYAPLWRRWPFYAVIGVLWLILVVASLVIGDWRGALVTALPVVVLVGVLFALLAVRFRVVVQQCFPVGGRIETSWDTETVTYARPGLDLVLPRHLVAQLRRGAQLSVAVLAPPGGRLLIPTELLPDPVPIPRNPDVAATAVLDAAPHGLPDFIVTRDDRRALVLGFLRAGGWLTWVPVVLVAVAALSVWVDEYSLLIVVVVGLGLGLARGVAQVRRVVPAVGARMVVGISGADLVVVRADRLERRVLAEMRSTRRLGRAVQLRWRPGVPSAVLVRRMLPAELRPSN